MKPVKYLLNYERFNTDTQNSYWEVLSKSFASRLERDKFILRISPNVFVRRIWTLEESL
jgi:hypothetical protein